MRILVILCLLGSLAYADEAPDKSSDKPPCADAAACKKACTKGDGESCWYAGAAFGPGDAGPGNPAKAKPFYERACKLGVVRGCLSLATKAAIKRAIALETKACAKKDPAACDDVAELYTSRLDKPDKKNATLFREKACRLRTNAPCAAVAPTCSDEPGAKEALEAATSANAKRFAEELARHDLKAIKLTQRRWPAAAGGIKVHSGSWTVGAVAEVDWQGKSVRVVVTPDIEDGCPATQVPLEYAQNDKTIYRVERVPRSTSSKSFKACKCAAPCGGPRAVLSHVGYEMPPGTVYGGAVKIAYDSDEVMMVSEPCKPAP